MYAGKSGQFAQIVLCLSLLAGAALAQDNPVLVGTVIAVTDGDTIKVKLSSGPISVRLGNVDAPESKQSYGRAAKDALTTLLGRGEVILDVVTQDRYERLVAIVYLRDLNVNAWLVKQGHAWAYRAYLEDPDYCVWENTARSLRRGLWAGDEWIAPWEWRRHLPTFTDYSAETAASCMMAKDSRSTTRVAMASEAPGSCRIKGNISENGHIYHVPGSPSYAETRIDELRGERWFCTTEEAKEAGWRPPRN